MKKLLSIVLFAITAAVFGAETPQTHRVDNLGNCYRLNEDGTETNIGQPADAIANNPSEASGIQRAALKLLADFQSKHASVITARDATIAASALALDQAKDALAERDARLEAAAKQIAALQKQVRDLGAEPVTAQ